MRVLLSSIGTRGDVQPVAVLAAALQRAGHDVVLAIPPDASPIARALDVPHIACGRDVTSWIAQLDTATISPAALVREFRDMLDHDLSAQAPILVEAARSGFHRAGADLVVTGGLQLLGNAVAERVGAASAYVCFGPNLLTSGDHPPLVVSSQRLPRLVNRMLHAATSFVADRFVMTAVNRERTRLGLATQRRFSDAMPRDVLLAWDASLCARPLDARGFGRGVVRAHNVGALMPASSLDADALLDASLHAFIHRDATPMAYVGFGSMPDHTPAQTFALVDEAARIANVRAVLLVPTLPALPALPASHERISNERMSNERVHVVTRVSHPALFPRMHAIVHHAGAGTTAAASRSGAPQIAVPHFLDQPMWAARLMQRGVSAATIARRSLDARSLARALRACIDDDALRDRARALRDELAAHDPRANAVRALETIALRHRTQENVASAEAIGAGAGFTATEALSR